MRRSWLEISLSDVSHNLGVIRSRISPSAQVIAVVKANAYGHGLEAVSRRLFREGVRSFGVAQLEEGRQLRSILPDVEIIVFGGCTPEEVTEFKELRLTAALFRTDWIPPEISLEIEIETGMGRLGIPPEDLRSLLQRCGDRVTGVYSTLASADVDPAYTRRQIDRFQQATEGLNLRRHLSNTAGLQFSRAAELQAVRPGLSLYGYGAGTGMEQLKPPLEWKSVILACSRLERNSRIGYGGSFVTDRSIRTAVVAAGYADGYRRAFSNRAWVSTPQGSAPVVGRVSMDVTTLDVSELKSVDVGDEVSLLDPDPEVGLSAAQLADWAETIPYEILTGIGPRVVRRYHE